MFPATQVKLLQVSATTHTDSHFQDSYSNHEKKCLFVILNHILAAGMGKAIVPHCGVSPPLIQLLLCAP